MTPDLWDAHDAQALRFELRRARTATVELRQAAVKFSGWLLALYARMAAADGTLTPEQQQTLRAAADVALGALSVDVATSTAAAVRGATALAVRQEHATLAEFHIDAAALDVVHADPVLLDAGPAATRILADAIADVRRFTAAVPLDTGSDVQLIAAKAHSPTARIASHVRFVTNRAINQTTLEIAKSTAVLTPPPVETAPAPHEPVELGPATTGRLPARSSNEPARAPLVAVGMRLVWVAERTACHVCGALSGQVIDPNSGEGFDEEATFGKPGSAMSVWPPGAPLMAPPRHPGGCRCRLRIISADNVIVPAALQREAQRSVARGWSDSDSRVQRLGAADRLLAHSALPKTVQQRSAADVGRGAFSARHRPRVPELRTD